MIDTFSPEIIYEAFKKGGFSVLRIDKFYNGDYAEIRAELDFKENLSVKDLQDITLKLKVIEETEGIKIQIVNIDMPHKSIRINFSISVEPDLSKTSLNLKPILP